MNSIFEDSIDFEFSSETNQYAENKRLSFVEKFPEAGLLSMPIEIYADVNSKETFIYWLEFKEILQGIGGGNASKFGIYKSNKYGQYCKSSGKKLTVLVDEELEKTFFELKQGIVKSLEYFDNSDFKAIENLHLPIWIMVLIKILCLYRPNKLLYISKSEVLEDCAKALGIENFQNFHVILLNRICLENLQKRKEFRDWNIEKLSDYIWHKFSKPSNKNLNSKQNFWLYAPGENARFWDEFYENGLMAIGWEKLGDLSLYNSKQEVSEKLKILENSSSDNRNNSSANFQFANEISVGDIVVPKRGKTEYLGYGIVTSDYFFDDSRTEYKSCRKVDWKKKGVWTETQGNIVLKTLTDITKYPDYVERLKQLIGIEQMEETQRILTNLPLNQILYGPPGTGKTFNSIEKAVEIATGNVKETHRENKIVFDELRKKGQIEFVTFHQNYTYEDFVVGIFPDVSAGVLRFDKREGIFKKLADKAKQNWLAASSPDELNVDFETVFNKFFARLFEEEVSEIEISMRSKSYKFKITLIDVENGRIKFTKQSGGTGHDLLIKNLEAIYNGNLDYGSDGLGVYYYPLVDKLKEFVTTILPEKNKVELRNFVLVIDEINRANISKVFGELITLLEDDKRLGAINELRLTLPNGEQDFSVPPNLFIIGTMNTADKSIALIDIALRRRFEFIAYYPNYHVIEPEKADLLQKLNTAIFEKKKSADYLIGHAYFMKNEPLEIVLRNKILPLLMEYFAGKTEIVGTLFNETDWEVIFDSTTYGWNITKI